jgi:hypothetical protein
LGSIATYQPNLLGLLSSTGQPCPAEERRFAVAGSGEIYKRADGKYAFRVKASNGQVVATDGSQGYDDKSSARSTLKRLMSGEYDGPIAEV